MEQLIDIIGQTAAIQHYQNTLIAEVNDHVVRMSVMTEDFYWHYHPNSDESFLVMDGIMLLDLLDRTVELTPGQMFTVPAGVHHRTRPKRQRSVNITFERGDIETVKLDQWPLS
jgi:mannose-6-phosphate isomerase-like protein (cupin superfamily)